MQLPIVPLVTPPVIEFVSFHDIQNIIETKK